MKSGKAIIFSAPSGSGKTTIVKHLLSVIPSLQFSISATTRTPREGIEVDSKDYYFLSKDEFMTKLRASEFIEWEEVYGGNYYGTLKPEIDRIWSEGNHVIFDVDVKGGLKLKDYFGDNALAVFVKVPDIVDIEERLKNRKTETKESLERRIEKARYEIGFQDKFDVNILNEELDKTLMEATNLVNDFLSTTENKHKT